MNPLSPLALLAIKALTIFALLAVVAGFAYHAGDKNGTAVQKVETDRIQKEWDDDRARMAQAALAETEHHAQNEAAIAAEKDQVVHEAQVAKAQRDAANASAAAAHRSLLDAARAVAAADSRRREADDHPAAVCGSGLPCLGALDLSGGVGAGKQPGDVLVDLLDGTDQAAGDLASYADELVVGLRSCRAEYEAVRLHSQ